MTARCKRCGRFVSGRKPHNHRTIVLTDLDRVLREAWEPARLRMLAALREPCPFLDYMRKRGSR